MYGASSSIVVSMLTPFARRVISRTRLLKRSKAFGAIARFPVSFRPHCDGNSGATGSHILLIVVRSPTNPAKQARTAG
jgi:hypothetical protein